jgi:hypothetical protein
MRRLDQHGSLREMSPQAAEPQPGARRPGSNAPCGEPAKVVFGSIELDLRALEIQPIITILGKPSEIVTTSRPPIPPFPSKEAFGWQIKVRFHYT